MRLAEKNHIGFDPVRWVERLMDVNAASEFGGADRTVIAAALARLRADLIRGGVSCLPSSPVTPSAASSKPATL